MNVADIARQARNTKVRGGEARANSNAGGKSNGKSIPFATSPVLGLRLPMWRSKLVVFLLFTAFAALVARALWIQGPGNSFYEVEGKKRFQRTLELQATRGKIVDRNGQVLATSLPVKAVWAVPEDVPEDLPTDKLKQLAALLEMNPSDVKRRIEGEKEFVYLKRQVNLENAEKIADLKIKGIYQQQEYKRFYPEGEVMAHVVGFTNVEDKGQEGMELAQQKNLAGSNGQRKVIKDRLGRVVEDVGVLAPPREGKDLQLAIDSKIQYVTFNELKAAVLAHKAKAGCAVVIDAQTGEILALANWPTYNPNSRADLSGEQLRNRVITDTFEPGSTMKPFTIALALERGKVTPDTIIDTAPGKLTIGPNTISDSHAHGALTVSQVIQKSSNVGTAKIALRFQPQDMWEMFESVGLGQAPKIGFPGAVAGRIRPYKNWRPIEQVTMSYGYGLSVSLLQMVRAYTIFAKDGSLLPLSITKLSGPVTGTPVIPAKTAAQIRSMLELASGPGGTAPKAQTMGYRVGGKTGTAHKLEGKTYAQNKYRGFYVGMAPMSQPRVIVGVMIDETTDGIYFGGDTAAPVFSAIVGNTLRGMNVEPDSSVRELVTTSAVQESVQ